MMSVDMAKRGLGKVIVLVCLASHSLHASVSAKELLSQAAAQFDHGNYKKAVWLIKSLDVRNEFDNSDDMKLAFKIRAVSYEETGDHKRAIETIKELFFLDPTYNFDPFDTPESVVKLAQKEKLLIDEKNKQIAAAKPVDEPKNHDPLAIKTPSIMIKKPLHKTLAFLPFGLNHFSLSSPIKGGIYLSLQSLGLLSNIGAYWWKQSYLNGFGSARLQDATNKGRFETAQTVQFLGLATWVISFGVSVIDAWISFKKSKDEMVSLPELTGMHDQ